MYHTRVREQNFKKPIFPGAPVGRRTGVPGKLFFHENVRKQNLEKVRKFEFHIVGHSEVPEPDMVARVILTPPQSE